MRRLLQGLLVASGVAAMLGGVFLLLAMTLPMPARPGMEPVASEIRDYLFRLDQPLLINHPALEQREERHLLDVKHVIQSITWLTLACGAITLGGLLVWSARKTVVRQLGQMGLAVVLLIGTVLVLGGFRRGFTGLHALLFPADSWWFASNSTLISLFPLAFFQQFALWYGISLLLVFTGCWWLARPS